MKSIKVWDLPTRVFHWSLVALVLIAYFSGEGRPYGLPYWIHIVSGYAVGLLVAFRLVWGLFGGEHARFGAFVRGWAAVKDHARSIVRLSPLRTPGHNPIGGWMIVLMLVMLFLIVVTGLLAQDKTGGTGPLTGLIPRQFMYMIGDFHSFLGGAILVVAGVHVAGVIVESVLNRENLVRAMVTGEKPAETPDARNARAAPLWRAAVLVVLLVAAGGYMMSVTTVPERTGAASHVKPVAEDE